MLKYFLNRPSIAPDSEAMMINRMITRMSTPAVVAALCVFVIILSAGLLMNRGGSAADGKCPTLRSETVPPDVFLSDIALREIKAQKVKWPENVSFDLLIQRVVVSIQFASNLNSSTPSAGTVIQIPDLNDPDC